MENYSFLCLGWPRKWGDQTKSSRWRGGMGDGARRRKHSPQSALLSLNTCLPGQTGMPSLNSANNSAPAWLICICSAVVRALYWRLIPPGLWVPRTRFQWTTCTLVKSYQVCLAGLFSPARKGIRVAAHQRECTKCYYTVHLKMVRMLNFMLCIFNCNRKIKA